MAPLLVWDQAIIDYRISPQIERRALTRKEFVRCRGDGRRIHSAAHKNAHAIGSQPVVYRFIQQFYKTLDVIALTPVPNLIIDRHRPVPPCSQISIRPCQRMSGGKLLDADEESRLRVFVAPPDEEIADGLIIQPVGDIRMKTNAVQSITHDQAIPRHGVIERLYSEMIAGAKQALLSLVPDGESEVADQIIDAIFSPYVIGMKNQ